MDGKLCNLMEAYIYMYRSNCINRMSVALHSVSRGQHPFGQILRLRLGGLDRIRIFPCMNIFPDISPSRIISPPYLWRRTFLPSTTTTVRSTIQSDLPLACTAKFIEIDRLGSGVWVSASFQVFVLTAGGMSQAGREIAGRETVRGEYVRGEMSSYT